MTDLEKQFFVVKPAQRLLIAQFKLKFDDCLRVFHDKLKSLRLRFDTALGLIKFKLAFKVDLHL